METKTIDAGEAARMLAIERDAASVVRRDRKERHELKRGEQRKATARAQQHRQQHRLVQRMRRSGMCSGAGAAAAAAAAGGGGGAAARRKPAPREHRAGDGEDATDHRGRERGNCDGAPYENAPIAGPIRPMSVPPPVT